MRLEGVGVTPAHVPGVGGGEAADTQVIVAVFGLLERCALKDSSRPS